MTAYYVIRFSYLCGHSYLSKLNGDGVDIHWKIPIFIVLWIDYDKNEAGQLRLTFRLVSFTIV